MAYVIGDDCIACGTCIDECPAGAISEGDKYSLPARQSLFVHFSFLIPHSSFKIYHQLAYEDGVLAVLVNRNRLAVHVLLVL